MREGDKRIAQRAHTRRRAQERYGVKLNKAAMAALIARIQSNRAKFVERQSNRITVWEVEHQSKRMRVVYDTKRGTIVTCLPN